MSGPDLAGRRVLVTGLGVSGTAAAHVLLALGAQVMAVDAGTHSGLHERAEALREAGARVDLGTAGVLALPGPAPDLVLTSPGWRPDAPLLLAAAAAGIPVWGEVELAWRLRGSTRWLAVTGTNGKTTATTMLAGILAAAGRRSTAVGNIGVPLVTAMADPPGGVPFDVVAVELSSFQLHWSHTVAPGAAAVLNVAPDHLDWHGSLAAYAADKARVFTAGAVAVGSLDDAGSRRLLAAAPGRQVGVTVGTPGMGELGVVDGWLLDRAFPGYGPGDQAAADGQRATGAEAVPLLLAADLVGNGPHDIANALAAAALARADGVAADAVAAGLRGYRPGEHRSQPVATVAVTGGSVTFVDDSKATNPHAAAASLAGYPPGRVVWIAGGLGKGLSVEELVAERGPHVKAAVLIGASADQLASAFARHAPQVRLERAPDLDHAVGQAVRLAEGGDTVLLAPAAASQDQFRDYAHRGQVFAAAALALPGATAPRRESC